MNCLKSKAATFANEVILNGYEWKAKMALCRVISKMTEQILKLFWQVQKLKPWWSQCKKTPFTFQIGVDKFKSSMIRGEISASDSKRTDDYEPLPVNGGEPISQDLACKLKQITWGGKTNITAIREYGEFIFKGLNMTIVPYSKSVN